ncbi:Receptor-type tyrosine-protein phosphatase eta [Fasciolopsis buskii]|uniref:Receptor-type tyrosine-protein phosphatase eta n=1 Tax=Fasciolopsis buskii TaxID=27845 RepID=A0A8E0SA45_9TREM|nr:Receptor-type tyrosine-protein phosphatase eta [Fasciolopsis buski]
MECNDSNETTSEISADQTSFQLNTSWPRTKMWITVNEGKDRSAPVTIGTVNTSSTDYIEDLLITNGSEAYGLQLHVWLTKTWTEGTSREIAAMTHDGCGNCNAFILFQQNGRLTDNIPEIPELSAYCSKKNPVVTFTVNLTINQRHGVGEFPSAITKKLTSEQMFVFTFTSKNLTMPPDSPQNFQVFMSNEATVYWRPPTINFQKLDGFAMTISDQDGNCAHFVTLKKTGSLLNASQLVDDFCLSVKSSQMAYDFTAEDMLRTAGSSETFFKLTYRPEKCCTYQISLSSIMGNEKSLPLISTLAMPKPIAPSSVTAEVNGVEMTVRWVNSEQPAGYNITNYKITSEPTLKSVLPEWVKASDESVTVVGDECTSYVFIVQAYDANMHLSSDPTTSQPVITSAKQTHVSPLTPNTLYKYQIVAVATYPRPVEGDYSETVNKTTMVEKPIAPSSVTAEVNGVEMTVRWVNSEQPAGYNITNYKITSEPTLKSVLPEWVKASDESVTVVGDECTSYVFIVQAYDANMHLSSDPTTSQPVITSAKQTHVSPLTPNTLYKYQIVAVATYPRPVEGDYSETVNKTTMVEKPIAPSSVTAEVNGVEMTVRWVNSEQPAGYNITNYKITSEPTLKSVLPEWVKASDESVTVVGDECTSYVFIVQAYDANMHLSSDPTTSQPVITSAKQTHVSPLTPNTLYKYQIVAVATYPRPVEGDYSETVNKTTMVEKPIAPSSVTAEVNGVEMTVRWVNSEQPAGYNITNYKITSEPTLKSVLPEWVKASDESVTVVGDECTSYVFIVQAYDANMHLSSDPTTSQPVITSAKQSYILPLQPGTTYYYCVAVVATFPRWVEGNCSDIANKKTLSEAVLVENLDTVLQRSLNVTKPVVTAKKITLQLNLDLLIKPDVNNMTVRVQPGSELLGAFNDDWGNARSWEQREKSRRGPWDILVFHNEVHPGAYIREARSAENNTGPIIVLGENQCNNSEYCDTGSLRTGTTYRPVDLRGAATSSEPQPIHVKDFLDYTGRCLRPNDPTLDHQYAAKGNAYINANFVYEIKHPTTDSKFVVMDPEKIEFIATQAPLESTFGDFWKMVLQERIFVIVMLSNLQEGGATKAHQYWPTDVLETKNYQYGSNDIAVTLVSEEESASCVVRRCNVVSAEDFSSMTVTQLQFTAWPDFGSPKLEDFKLLMQMYQKIVSAVTEKDAPILVHCSAGVGRTGTFIAGNILFRGLVAGDTWVDIYGIVKNLRLCRSSMVQKPVHSPSSYLIMFLFESS